MEYTLRFLQETKPPNDVNSTITDANPGYHFPGQDNPPSITANQGKDAYEFVAFLLWYLFLVLCCVIPTCCAYRRRRLMEARIAEQQESVSRIEQQNLFILSSLGHSQRNSDQIRALRSTKITEQLKETTMTVQLQNIVDAPEDSIPDNVVRVGEDSRNKTNVSVDYDIEAPDFESTHCLQIPKGEGGQTHRNVPGACAICLCPYEPDDQVTWSPRDACQHAFHSECIIPWLAKSEEPKCPCCRQDFCEPVLPTDLALPGGNHPIHRVFGPALANFIQEEDDDIAIPHFLRMIEQHRLEFLATLERAASDPPANQLGSEPNVNMNINGVRIGGDGGSPFEIANGSTFQIVPQNEASNQSDDNSDDVSSPNNNNNNSPSTEEESQTQPTLGSLTSFSSNESDASLSEPPVQTA